MDQFSVIDIRHLSSSTYILKFNRAGIEFLPGQHINLGVKGSGQYREYSIYSGTDEDDIEVLIKEVDDGLVSRDLKQLKRGAALNVKGPYGFFLTDASANPDTKYLFIASGTGIAPFHSFIRSNPESDYMILHGIRRIDESYEREHYAEHRYISCTSREIQGDFNGRITDFLQKDQIPEKADKVFLCGNSSMIYDAMGILRSKGYRHDQIFTEIYF